MKKILQITSLFITTCGFTQNSMQMINTVNSTSIAPNGIVYLGTIAGNNTNIVIDVKNTSAATNTYVIYRYDAILNSGATAYFCFAGSCFGSGTMVSGNLVLNAGQSASQSTMANTMLTADLDEGGTVGLSHVKYTLRNANTIADSIQINLRYNDVAAGVKEISNSVTPFDVSPNPASDRINVSFAFKGNATSGEINVINALGQVIITKPIGFVDGKNNISLNINELPKGIYFVRIKNAEAVTTKRIIVN